MPMVPSQEIHSRPPDPPLRCWVAAGFASWLIAGALYLALPPSPDQFNHAYVGWRVAEGARLSVDVMDMNWPGIAWGHAFAVRLFGTRIWSWHAYDLIAFAIASACLADLLRIGYGRRAGLALIVAAPWAYVAYGYWLAGQHDMSAAQWLTLALWCHARGDFRPMSRWTLAAGVALGVAVMCKPTMALALAFLPLQGLWLQHRLRRIGGAALSVSFAVAGTVALAVALLVMLGTPLGNLVDVMWTFNAARRIDKAVDYGAMLRLTGWWPVGLGLISLPAILRLAAPAQRNAAATSLPVLWLTGLASYILQARGNSYHLAAAALAYIAWAATVAAMALDRQLPPKRRLLPGLLFAVFILGIASRIVLYFGNLPAAWSARDPSIHLAQFRENDGLSIGDSWQLSQDIARRDDSGCLLVVGRTSSVNLLSGLPQPTRFYYFNAIKDPPAALAPRWTEQWEADLDRARCRFALVTDAAWLAATSTGTEADRVHAALRRLLEHYPIHRRIDDSQWTLYERTPP